MHLDTRTPLLYLFKVPVYIYVGTICTTPVRCFPCTSTPGSISSTCSAPPSCLRLYEA